MWILIWHAYCLLQDLLTSSWSQPSLWWQKWLRRLWHHSLTRHLAPDWPASDAPGDAADNHCVRNMDDFICLFDKRFTHLKTENQSNLSLIKATAPTGSSSHVLILNNETAFFNQSNLCYLCLVCLEFDTWILDNKQPPSSPLLESVMSEISYLHTQLVCMFMTEYLHVSLFYPQQY